MIMRFDYEIRPAFALAHVPTCAPSAEECGYQRVGLCGAILMDGVAAVVWEVPGPFADGLG